MTRRGNVPPPPPNPVVFAASIAATIGAALVGVTTDFGSWWWVLYVFQVAGFVMAFQHSRRLRYWVFQHRAELHAHRRLLNIVRRMIPGAHYHPGDGGCYKTRSLSRRGTTWYLVTHIDGETNPVRESDRVGPRDGSVTVYVLRADDPRITRHTLPVRFWPDGPEGYGDDDLQQTVASRNSVEARLGVLEVAAEEANRLADDLNIPPTMIVIAFD